MDKMKKICVNSDGTYTTSRLKISTYNIIPSYQSRGKAKYNTKLEHKRIVKKRHKTYDLAVKYLQVMDPSL